MSNTKKITLGAVLFVLVASTAFYFLYFIRTPAYALNAAREAAQSHDLQKFERYVDINSVMDNAFEDVIKAESKINNDGIFSNPFALGILHMLKPAVVQLMEQEARDKIANRSEPAEAGKTVDPVPDAMRRNMERHVPVKKMTIKDISVTKHEGQQAVASISLHHAELNKDFAAEVILEHNAKGDWQIKNVANLADLIIQFDAAKKAQQAANNKGIIDRLNAAAGVGEVHLHLIKDSNPDKPQTFLTATVTVTNNTQTTINRMYYDVTILDEDGKELYSYPEHFRGEIAPGKSSVLNTSKPLNALLPDDKKLMSLDVEKQKARIQITYIAFNDGNVLSPNTFME